MEASWNQRINKAGRYLAQGDIGGLFAELRQYIIWRQKYHQRKPGPTTATVDEATFWDKFDADLGRRVGWGSAGGGYFGVWALQEMIQNNNVQMSSLIEEMITVPTTEPLHALVLGCGDMAGEHAVFLDPALPFSEIDAYDISPESVKRARELTEPKGLPVKYHVADLNQVELPANRYALVIVFQSYHHFERVDYIAQQVNHALLPDGIFYVNDYIGPRQLQWSDDQLHYARQLLKLLPTHYRRRLNGEISDYINRVPPENFSPDEAICSDQILPAINKHFNVVYQYNWAGLLYPLLEGIAFNFTTSDEDIALLKLLFDLDYALCQSGKIDPNFTITLAKKRL